MTSLVSALGHAGRNGRLLLVLGLAAGLLLPGLAAAMRPYLPELVAGLLFAVMLRIGPRQAFGAFGELKRSVSVIVIYQVAFPLMVLAVFGIAGAGAHSVVLALALVFAAPPLAGSPNLAILTGFSGTPALRLVVLGTAILPITVLPVFLLLPEFEGASTILASVARLLGVIAMAGLAAMIVRSAVSGKHDRAATDALDGLSAILMAVVVIGLMSALGPALASDPWQVAFWLTVAFAANLGPQVATAIVLRRADPETLVPLSIVSGNRNIALFLVALPAETADELLTFIGCYQVPMYLTPIIMRRFYQRIALDDRARR